MLAKGKLTPKHAVSIPRLELCAAVLATSLVFTIASELEKLAINSVTYYTDSKVVLGYISNESRRFHVYVANRVHKIHVASDPSQWRHVPTDQNPADLITRTVPANQLMASTWFRGPDFLWLPHTPVLEGCEPIPGERRPLNPSDPDVRQKVHAHATEVKSDSGKDDSTNGGLECRRFQRFSSWQSLRRAVANLRMRVKSQKSERLQGTGSQDGRQTRTRAFHGQLTGKDFHEADVLILKAVQQECFIADITHLQSTGDEGQQRAIYKQTNPLRKLNPFLDEEGLLRVGGRLRQSDIDLGGRHPILLPKESHVSKLIADKFHRDVQHQGRHSTIGAIRTGGFWILGVNGIVRSLINECTTCKRLRATPLTQQMADLPKDRTDASPPFTNIGMDVFGPWTIITRRTRGGSADSKRWAVMFTCLSSRAVHVEVIESMDTSSLIMALRRFMATRGPVSRLRCDRGTNFVGACNELDAATKDVDHGRLQQFMSLKGIEWDFNPPHASHFGGIWEHQIRTLRSVLNSMFLRLGKHQLTHEVLVTFMAEAAAIINSRPICGISSDANDPAPLTPNMLLTQKTTPLQPIHGDFTYKDLYSRKRWRRTQYLADQFWVRWRKEYLQSLQPRQKWSQPQPDITTGDVVLLREKEVSRGCWPLARVVKTQKSEDGRIRKADDLVCTDGVRRTFSRPISELILIEKSISEP